MKVVLGLGPGLLLYSLLHIHATVGGGMSSLHLEAVCHPLSKQSGAVDSHA